MAALGLFGAAWLALRQEPQPLVDVERHEDSSPGSGPVAASLENDAAEAVDHDGSIDGGMEPPPAGRTSEAVPPTETLEVLVTDREGRGIPAARVRAIHGPIAGEFIADADGRCLIQVPIVPVRPWSFALPRPMIALDVEAAGFFHTSAFFERQPPIRVQLSQTKLLRGRVLDADTKAPLEGAIVEVDHGCNRCSPGRTDATGSFAVDAPKGQTVHVWVGMENGPVTYLELPVDLPFGVEEHEILLARGIEIRGSVVDLTTGAPVADVAIFDTGQFRRALTRTASDGTFRAQWLPASEDRFVIGVQAAGYCWLEREWTPEALEQALPIRVELPKFAGIEGIVRDPAGRGLPDLNVVFGPDLAARAEGRSAVEAVPPRLRDAVNGWQLANEGTVGVARTDGSGRFRLEHLLPWMPCYRLWSPPNQAGSFAIDGGPLGGPGEVIHVDVTADVVSAGQVKGRLLLNGEPIEGQLGWKGATREGFGATTSEGRFSLDGIEAGAVIVEVERSTGRVNASMGFRSTYEIEVKPGELLVRDFDLVTAMSAVSGRVTTAEGMPAPRTRVFLHVPARPEEHSPFEGSTETDVDGRWSIDVPADSRPFTVRAGEWPNQPERVGVAPGTSDVDFVLKSSPASNLRIRVVDGESGAALPDSQVYWRELTAFAGQSLTSGREPAVQDDDGWFVGDVPMGTLELYVAASGAYAPTVLRDVRVPFDGGVVRIEVSLRKGSGISLRLAAGQEDPPDGRIGLVLLTSDELSLLPGIGQGRAPRFVDVHLALGGLLLIERQTGVIPDYISEISRLAPGLYHLVVVDSDVRIDPEEIEVGPVHTTVEIRWRPK